MSKKKPIIVTRRYVEVFNESNAIEIARILNSTYRRFGNLAHSMHSNNENHFSYWVTVPDGKWTFAKKISKEVVSNIPRCISVKFIRFTSEDKILITTS